MKKQYYVYIMTNKYNTVLCVGVTNDLKRRVSEHKSKLVEGFTKKYNLDKLVYYEIADNPYQAITGEKQFKAGSRLKELRHINKFNGELKDLYETL